MLAIHHYGSIKTKLSWNNIKGAAFLIEIKILLHETNMTLVMIIVHIDNYVDLNVLKLLFESKR
jgi:hypothetical protein